MLHHKGTVRLESRRLVLRRFTMDDVDAMFHGWSSDPEVVRHLRMRIHAAPLDAQRMISQWLEDYHRADFYLWALERKEDGKLLGSLSLSVANEHDQVGEVAYCISREFWGKGYVPEALELVIGEAFGELGFNRIQAAHSLANPASGRVMVKAGMIYEGRARQSYLSNAGFEDCDTYAILRKDWAED